MRESVKSLLQPSSGLLVILVSGCVAPAGAPVPPSSLISMNGKFAPGMVSGALPVAGTADPIASIPVEAAEPEVEAEPVSALTIPMKLSYGQISRHFAEKWREALGQFVRMENCTSVAAGELRCGELPVGRIVDDSAKELLRLQIPAQSGSDDGVKFTTEAAVAMLQLDRRQLQDEIEMPMLDGRSSAAVKTSARFGNDVFLKLRPRGGVLEARVCAVIPSVQAKIPALDLRGKLKKEIRFLPDMKSDFRVHVSMGKVRLGAARACADLEIEQVKAGRFRARVVEVSAPRYSKVEFEGLDVRVNADVGGFWGVVGNVTQLVGKDIEDEVARAVARESTELLEERLNVASREIRSGAWMKEYLDVVRLQKVVNRATRQFSQALTKSRFAEKQTAAVVQGSCLMAAAGLSGVPDSTRAAFFKLCRSSAVVDLEQFVETAEMEKSGCQDYFFHPARSGWWSKQCHLQSEARLSFVARAGAPDVAPLFQCLASAWNGSPSAAGCRSEAMALAQGLTPAALVALSQIPSLPALSESEQRELLEVMERAGAAMPATSVLQRIWN